MTPEQGIFYCLLLGKAEPKPPGGFEFSLFYTDRFFIDTDGIFFVYSYFPSELL